MKRKAQPMLSEDGQQALDQYMQAFGYLEDLSLITIRNYLNKHMPLISASQNLRHGFGYRMAEIVPLHPLTQVMGHNSLDTTTLYIRSTEQDLQLDVEKIAWI